jgi:hypothetical protein
MRFATTIEPGGKTATGFAVPSEIVEGLASGKRPPVTVTIGGHTYRSTIAVMSGRFMIPLSAENRQAAGVGAGDKVEVDIELDTHPRVLEVPDDLAVAIAADAAAARGGRSHRPEVPDRLPARGCDRRVKESIQCANPSADQPSARQFWRRRGACGPR